MSKESPRKGSEAKGDGGSPSGQSPDPGGSRDLLQPRAAPPGLSPPVASPTELLSAGDTLTILRRLSAGDPLRLLERCAARVRRLAFLVDPERLHRRAIARVALEAPGWSGDPPVEQWITDRIDETIHALLRGDREAFHDERTDASEHDARFAFLSRVIGVDPEHARIASVDFNSLSAETRRAFFDFVFRQQNVEEYLHGDPDGADDLRERVFQALGTLRRVKVVAGRRTVGSNEEETP